MLAYVLAYAYCTVYDADVLSLITLPTYAGRQPRPQQSSFYIGSFVHGGEYM